MLRSGETFAGYLIERELGRGGMGSVYLAQHPRLPRRTALKLLNRELFGDNEVRARFEREADLIARLEHPHIVPIYDRGIEGDRLWISMRYIDGVDASSLNATELPPQQAIRIIADTAKALDFAHRKGVLHRDVKPANILLERDEGEERVFLADFGIARLREDSTRLTQTGSFTATLAYAAPEQLIGKPLDHRCDQYSLACTLFRLLTGDIPFAAEHPVAIMQGHLNQPPPPVSLLRPGLPQALDAVMARAMAKEPADRFDSCTAFAVAAQQALAAPTGYAPTRQLPPNAAPAGNGSGRGRFEAKPPAGQAWSGPGAPQVGEVPGSPARQFAPPRHGMTPPRTAAMSAPFTGQPAARQFLNGGALVTPARGLTAPGGPVRGGKPPGARTVFSGKPPAKPRKRRSKLRGCLLGLLLIVVVPVVAVAGCLAYADRQTPSTPPAVITNHVPPPGVTDEQTYDPTDGATISAPVPTGEIAPMR
ncbi:MAG: Non-specific serine/threonine protein kinase [Nocardia sp.]|uniref:serine/threonine-protein kinase n=1 Tax=Nocardia sp. TaxID=1821 RepID=UPI002610E0EF|nr:serine/threonine-protein kinase [Nocardia sp.]MCU1643636.1 Non-specific serine/threonine protein kinase [Nocardia sp.]